MTTALGSSATVLDASPEAARHVQSLQLRNFLASLVTSAAIFATEVSVFVLLKGRLKNLVSPDHPSSAKILSRCASQSRTHLEPEGQRTIQPPSGTISWIPRMFQLPDRIILQHPGLDAFFFLRYIRTLLTIFTSLSLVVIPCPVPLSLLGSNNAAGATHGLDRFGGANIGLDPTAF